jgi:hypothetical protein
MLHLKKSLLTRQLKKGGSDLGEKCRYDRALQQPNPGTTQLVSLSVLQGVNGIAEGIKQ